MLLQSWILVANQYHRLQDDVVFDGGYGVVRFFIGREGGYEKVLEQSSRGGATADLAHLRCCATCTY